jgi:hypothetical protein
MAGATGLDYNAISAVFRLRRIPRSEWSSIFSDVQIMEEAALEFFREQTQES